MMNWNDDNNWTKEQFAKVLKNAISRGDEFVGLDTEYATYQNELDISRWSKELGFDSDIQTNRVVVILTK